MANIDYLIQNSTKKILDLVKKLPQREQVANAVEKSELSSSSGTKRTCFQKHPRHFTDEDVVITSEEDPTTSTYTHATTDELVILKNPIEDKSQESQIRFDSTDELCDITIRSDAGKEEVSRETPDEFPPMCVHADDESIICNGARRKDYSSTTTSSKKVYASESKSESYLKFVAKDSDIKLPSAKGKARKVKKEREELRVLLDPKIKNLIERSINFAVECRTLFQCGIPAPDGDDDYQRRRKRSVEFSSRFSRNYLYNLNRTITDIDVAIQAASVGRFTTKGTNSFILSHKFFTAFQTISLALDAYSKHIPTSIVKGIPEKFKELVGLIVKLLTLFRVVGDYEEGKDNVIDLFEDFCKAMMFDDGMNLPTPPEESASTASAAQPKPIRETRRQGDGGPGGKGKQSRLSMYAVPQRKDANWKNAVAALAKKKYQVQSKYKTATFKHRPPPAPTPPAPLPPPLKLAPRRDKKRKSRSAKLVVIDIDKNVQTFVEGEVSTYRDHPSHRIPNAPRPSPIRRKPNALKAHATAFYEKVTKDKIQKMNINEYECILDHFLEAVGMEHPARDGAPKEVVVRRRLERKFGKSIEDMPFQEFVDNIINYANRNEQPTLSPVNIPTRCGKKSEKRAIKKAKKSAAAHLAIHSSDAHAGPVEIVSQMEQFDPTGHLRHRLSDLSISEADECNKLIYKERGENGEMQSKLDSCSPRRSTIPATTTSTSVPEVLKMLPKETILSVIEYKLTYHKESRENFMYTVTDDATPWLLVESVGDAILEEMLIAVSRDIQVDKILKKIYAQEFK